MKDMKITIVILMIIIIIGRYIKQSERYRSFYSEMLQGV